MLGSATPRGQIVNKRALLREVETDKAALVELAIDMDAPPCNSTARRPVSASSKLGNAPALSWIPVADASTEAPPAIPAKLNQFHQKQCGLMKQRQPFNCANFQDGGEWFAFSMG